MSFQRRALVLLLGVSPLMFAGCGGCGGSTAGTGTTGKQSVRVINLGDDAVNHQSAIGDNGLMAGVIVTGGLNTLKETYFADTWQVGDAQPAALPGPGEQGAQNGTDTSAECLSSQGVLGGREFFLTPFNGLPALWENGSFKALAVPSGFSGSAFDVTSINSSLQTIGIETPGPVQISAIKGFYWASPSAVGIALPFYPTGISDTGTAVGFVTTNETTFEFFKMNVNQTTTTATDLGFGMTSPNLATGPPGTFPSITVDPSGNIYLTTGASYELLEISSSGKQTKLGTGAVPIASNAKGDVVGETLQGHAFIYTPSKGVVDMNSLLGSSSGLVLQAAYSINNEGQVLCIAQPTGSSQQDCVVVELLAGQF